MIVLIVYHRKQRKQQGNDSDPEKNKCLSKTETMNPEFGMFTFLPVALSKRESFDNFFKPATFSHCWEWGALSGKASSGCTAVGVTYVYWQCLCHKAPFALCILIFILTNKLLSLYLGSERKGRGLFNMDSVDGLDLFVRKSASFG